MPSAHFKPDAAALVPVVHRLGALRLNAAVSPETVLPDQAAGLFDMRIAITSGQMDHVHGPLHPAMWETYAARVGRAGGANAWSVPDADAAIEASGHRQPITAAVTTDIRLVLPAIGPFEAGYDVRW